MDEIQRVLIQSGRKDLAKEYYKKIAGRTQPDIKSSSRGTINLRSDDFKNRTTFDYIIESLKLDDEFRKEIKKVPESDEPETTLDDYDEIEVQVVQSILR